MLLGGVNAERKVNQRSYVTGLDGLRALAVLAVLFYHFGFPWARGGFLGVDIFFVISGFLITSILLPHKGEGSGITLNVSLGSFWMGRVRRLVPAAYATLLASVGWASLVKQNLLHTLWGETLSSVFYSSNWWFIFREVSYFDSFGSPSPIKNLWSLAIEQQFYLLWPLLLAAGVKFCHSRKTLFFLVLAGALGSAVWMAVLYQPGEDPSRIYYGTDTRCFELLIGSLLAMVSPLNRISTINRSFAKKVLSDASGVLALTGFAASIVLLDEFDGFLYQGGMLLFCINGAILVAAVCSYGSFLGRVLSWRPLRWVGTRSYGIYLWHYPIIIFTTPVHELGHPVYWRVGLQVAAAFLLAELSHRFLETPIRQLGFRGAARKLAEHVADSFEGGRRKALSAAFVSFLFFVFALGMTGSSATEREIGQVPNLQAEKNQQEVLVTASVDQQKEAEQSKLNMEREESKREPEAQSEIDQGEVSPPQDIVEETDMETLPGSVEHGAVTEGDEQEQDLRPNVNTETRKNPYQAILAVGDSLTINLSDSLQSKYENITVDGKVGRQMSQAIELTSRYKNFNDPQKAVIIQLGTNGYFTEKQLDTLLDAFTDAPIYLINVRVPRNWEYKVNEALAKKAVERNNVTLIDWYAKATDHPEYFSSDGVHLRAEGVEVLTGLIDQALRGGENSGIAFVE